MCGWAWGTGVGQGAVFGLGYLGLGVAFHWRSDVALDAEGCVMHGNAWFWAAMCGCMWAGSCACRGVGTGLGRRVGFGVGHVEFVVGWDMQLDGMDVGLVAGLKWVMRGCLA